MARGINSKNAEIIGYIIRGVYENLNWQLYYYGTDRAAAEKYADKNGLSDSKLYPIYK
jgi:hypothetical protein